MPESQGNPAFACTFCDSWMESGDVCGFCGSLREKGRAARRRMVPMEDCPWMNGDPRASEVLGEADYHDVSPLGTEGSCPWCSGWAEEERRLFDELKGGG